MFFKLLTLNSPTCLLFQHHCCIKVRLQEVNKNTVKCCTDLSFRISFTKVRLIDHFNIFECPIRWISIWNTLKLKKNEREKFKMSLTFLLSIAFVFNLKTKWRRKQGQGMSERNSWLFASMYLFFLSFHFHISFLWAIGSSVVCQVLVYLILFTFSILCFHQVTVHHCGIKSKKVLTDFLANPV